MSTQYIAAARMNFAFDAVFYYVSNLDRAVAFYRDVLGLSFRSRDAVARFDIGGVLFEVVPTGDRAKLSGDGNARLCLRVNDIVATVAELRRRQVRVADPAIKENGILASFYDPDDNEICLWEYRE